MSTLLEWKWMSRTSMNVYFEGEEADTRLGLPGLTDSQAVGGVGAAGPIYIF